MGRVLGLVLDSAINRWLRQLSEAGWNLDYCAANFPRRSALAQRVSCFPPKHVSCWMEEDTVTDERILKMLKRLIDRDPLAGGGAMSMSSPLVGICGVAREKCEHIASL